MIAFQSHFPFGFLVGTHFIAVHLITDILAFSLGIRYYFRLRKKDFLTDEQRMLLILAAAFGALIGSRLLAWFERPDMLFGQPLLYYLGTRTVVGGLIGGWLSIEFAKKLMRVKRSTGDLFVYALLLGMMIGRIGCFLTGVSDATIGLPTSLPWGMDQGDGILRHPAALYEIVFLGLLWLFIKKREHKLREGDRFKVFMASYAVFRLCIEFIKPRTPLFIGLSSIQLACLGVLLYYGITFARRRRTR